MGQGGVLQEREGTVSREHEVTSIERVVLAYYSHLSRDILGPAMQCIRFPCMALQEFADSPAQSGMLSLQETTDIFLNFTAKQKPEVEYPSTPRLGMTPLTCHR